jgi:hypothetical protein
MRLTAMEPFPEATDDPNAFVATIATRMAVAIHRT